MAALTWILTFLCAAGGHLSPASPVLRSALVVPAGQNAMLPCNLTSCSDLTWYLLRSDHLLPLLTVTSTKLGGDTVTFYTADEGRFNRQGGLESGGVSLEIQEVQQEDAGLYFCSCRCKGAVCVDRGIHLALDGADEESARQPCWSLGICVLPAVLVLCVFVIIVGFCLCSGKPAVCCCNSVSSNTSLQVSEDVSLHYSSLKHADNPRPSGRGRTGLVGEDVTYSKVASCKNPNRSHVHR